MTVGSQPGEFQFETYGYTQFSIPMEFVFRLSGVIKLSLELSILVEDPDTGGPSLITVS